MICSGRQLGDLKCPDPDKQENCLATKVTKGTKENKAKIVVSLSDFFVPYVLFVANNFAF
jgi:hypothetical protein